MHNVKHLVDIHNFLRFWLIKYKPKDAGQGQFHKMQQSTTATQLQWLATAMPIFVKCKTISTMLASH
jgi:hypothetical protein